MGGRAAWGGGKARALPPPPAALPSLPPRHTGAPPPPIPPSLPLRPTPTPTPPATRPAPLPPPHPPLQHVDLLWLGLELHLQIRAGLVHQVDCLVWEEAIGDVAVCGGGGGVGGG